MFEVRKGFSRDGGFSRSGIVFDGVFCCFDFSGFVFGGVRGGGVGLGVDGAGVVSGFLGFE